ncbi:MAG: helix-turn-helix transcriptional regulator [Flavobacterium sp.]|nr:helix-turn-helix transcriptional regulator [Flavobacterium sp.]
MKYNITYQATVTPMTILKEHLDKCAVDYKLTGMGEVELEEGIPEDRYKELEASLNRYSIEILNDEKSQLVQRVKNLLLELAYDDKPQLMTLSCYLSSQLNFSYGYISYIFTMKTLTSIENYLIMLRIERAKKLIIEDILSLKEISAALNYSSIGHFSRQFKKTTGITISVFKKIITNRRNRPLVKYQ